MEFLVDVLDVKPHGLDGNAQTLGDHFIAEAVDKAGDDLALLAGKRCARIGFVFGAEIIDDFTGDLRRHGGAAAASLHQSFGDFGQRRVFQKITRSAGAQGLENFMGIISSVRLKTE